MPRLTAENLHLIYPVNGVVKGKNMVTTPERRILGRGGKVKGVYALYDINFDLKAGDRLGIIGRNGAGKTTLLGALAGLYAPDRGQITAQGRITNLINIQVGLRNHATGHRNITLRGLTAGYTHEQIELVREDIAAFSELGHFLDMPISTYSSGMRMRLSFAIATAFEPDILILDEWLSTGDLAFREKATARMKEFVDQAGVIVLASHNRNLLEENCNRAIWLDKGEIREAGAVSEVYDRYEAVVGGAPAQKKLEAE